MTKILIAGGAGFIGSNLTKRLLFDNYEVIVVDNCLTGVEKNIEMFNSNPKFTFINHDITVELPKEITAEVVFHLASPASPNHHSKISYHALPMQTMMANTVGTLGLLKFAERNNAKFLFASTSEIYGDPLVHPQTEEYRGNVSTVGPRSVYDEAKRFGETLVSYYWREKNLDARIARIFNTYGPNMGKEDFRMIARFIQQALANEPITIFGDGSQTRSLCFIDDLIDGLIRLTFNDNTNKQVVNLGNPQEHSVKEYAEIVRSLTGSKSEIIFSEELPQDDPVRRKPDISKARNLLDWEPKISLEEGLIKMIEYIKSL